MTCFRVAVALAACVLAGLSSADGRQPIPPTVTISAPKTGTTYKDSDQILVYAKWVGLRANTTVHLQWNPVFPVNAPGANGSQMTVQVQGNGEVIFAPIRLPAGDYKVKVYTDDPNSIGDFITITVTATAPPGCPPPPAAKDCGAEDAAPCIPIVSIGSPGTNGTVTRANGMFTVTVTLTGAPAMSSVNVRVTDGCGKLIGLGIAPANGSPLNVAVMCQAGAACTIEASISGTAASDEVSGVTIN
jgi:hypothetical protein